MDNLKIYKSVRVYNSNDGKVLYETSDGKIFKDLQEAKNHQYRLFLLNKLWKFIDKHFQNTMTKGDIVQTLEVNWKELFDLLKRHKNYIDM